MPTRTEDVAWILRRRMREQEQTQAGLSELAHKSRTWANAQLFKDPIVTLWSMYQKEPEALEALAMALGYKNRHSMLVELRIVSDDDLLSLAVEILNTKKISEVYHGSQQQAS